MAARMSSMSAPGRGVGAVVAPSVALAVGDGLFGVADRGPGWAARSRATTSAVTAAAPTATAAMPAGPSRKRLEDWIGGAAEAGSGIVLVRATTLARAWTAPVELAAAAWRPTGWAVWPDSRVRRSRTSRAV